MLTARTLCAAAFLLGVGCLLTAQAPRASAQDKKDPDKSDTVLTKSDSLTDDDEMDTGPQTRKSHRKVYKVKLTAGKAYRIDLTSQSGREFDTFLRLEDAAGKQVAFNDDADPPALDSRVLYAPGKTGEYRIIATTFVPGQTGKFKLEVKVATGAEADAARLQTRLESFGDATPAEQKKLIAEVTKDLMKRGEDVTVKDAQLAIQLAMQIDESNVELTRAVCKDFAKIFDAASNKKLAVVGKILEQQVLKNLDKIGKDIEITGKTTDGKDFDLKNLKGKVVLVDFWATWCGPCIAEIPNIVDAHKKYNSKGFEVIGVSLDKGNEEIDKFVEARKLPWKSINVEDSAKLADKYGVNAIPHPILVGRDGRIVSLRARGPQLERLLERLLAAEKK